MKTRPKINFNCYEGLCQIIQLEAAPEHMSVWTAWTAEGSNTRGELAAPIRRSYSREVLFRHLFRAESFFERTTAFSSI